MHKMGSNRVVDRGQAATWVLQSDRPAGASGSPERAEVRQIDRRRIEPPGDMPVVPGCIVPNVLRLGHPGPGAYGAADRARVGLIDGGVSDVEGTEV
jgi:hypothetical protein